MQGALGRHGSGLALLFVSVCLSRSFGQFGLFQSTSAILAKHCPPSRDIGNLRGGGDLASLYKWLCGSQLRGRPCFGASCSVLKT